MLPGKTYKPEDFVEILWRRKWLAIVPFVLLAVGTAIATQFLPDRYRSEARVLILPQQVPENYVQATVTTPLEQRLQAISAQILSRTQLERIIQDFNLYPEARKTAIMEDVVAQMRRDVRVNIDRVGASRFDANAFSVGFEAENPRTAMQVAERLAQLFVSENLQNRTVQADQTNLFLETQLEDARRRLVEHEEKLAAFRRRYDGQLPSQVPTNLGVMQGAQSQLEALGDSIGRDRDRLAYLERAISDLMATANAIRIARADGTGGGAETAAQQLATAREGLRALELRLKPEHPDIIRARRVVRELEAKAEAEAKNTPLATRNSVPAGLSSADQQRLSDLRAEREVVERRIARSQAEEERLQQMLGAYRSRIEVAPTRETELTELTRDYETIKQSYEDLKAKSLQSKIAADLERRQIGEQFRIIDAARLPERPFSPDRRRLNMLGALAGLALGLGLVALLEYRDTTLRTDDDVTISLALPVLAVIPLMVTDGDMQRTRQRRIALVSASVLVIAAAAAVVFWKMDVVAGWLR